MRPFVIADVAGQYDALMEIVKKARPNQTIVLVGDMVDRGPKSKEVIEWCMAHKEVVCLMGNHEHMMMCTYMHTFDYDFVNPYEYDDWFNNGGYETIISYGGKISDIPPEHIGWIRNLPYNHIQDDVHISHAPWCDSNLSIQLIWNRNPPLKMKGMFQVFGHNSNWGLRYFEDWAVCIDQSRLKRLCAIDCEDRRIHVVPY